MKLKIIRRIFTENSTIGELYIYDRPECFTLEDMVREPGIKIAGKTAIPYGEYKVIINMSNRFKQLMPIIYNNPIDFSIEKDNIKFSGVRIHSGNYANQTDGCILVGKSIEVDMINDSKTAFVGLVIKIQNSIVNKEDITLDIIK